MHRILSRRWSALLISLFITTIVIIIALYLLDKIVPFSRDVKGIENGNIAYYHAEAGINEALLAMSGSNPGYESGASTLVQNKGYIFAIRAAGDTIPQAGEGTSEYDPNWNRIGPSDSLQLVLPPGINWANVTMQFRVPDLDHGGPNIETLSGTSTTPMINWILSGSGESLIASGSQIMASAIYTSDGTAGSIVNFASKNGITSTGLATTFTNFYNSALPPYCASRCSLKLSILSPLDLTVLSATAPYLEYQLHMGNPNPPIPYQYATIEWQGYSLGFRKDITRRIRQTTTSEAADFTIFQ